MDIRSRILQAGLDLLHRQGLAALSQTQVARAAGVGQGHLTYYFPTRNDLLLAIAEAAIEHTLAALQDGGGNAPHADLGEQIGRMLPGQPQVRVLLGLIVAADRQPELRGALAGLIGRVRAHLGTLLSARGCPLTDDRLLLLHAGIVGLAVMNEARRNDESEAETRRGAAALLNLLTADGGGAG